MERWPAADTAATFQRVDAATNKFRERRLAETMRLEGFDDVELAQFADCALASLHARMSGSESRELSEAIEAACDAWDRFADLLPDFRAL